MRCSIALICSAFRFSRSATYLGFGASFFVGAGLLLLSDCLKLEAALFRPCEPIGLRIGINACPPDFLSAALLFCLVNELTLTSSNTLLISFPLRFDFCSTLPFAGFMPRLIHAPASTLLAAPTNSAAF